jgi:hypothetical protein
MIRWFKKTWQRIKAIWQMPATVEELENRAFGAIRNIHDDLQDTVRWREALQAWQSDCNGRLVRCEDTVARHTAVHADYGMERDQSTIIVIGRWKGADYVRIHTLAPQHWEYFVEELRKAEKLAPVGRVDRPRGVMLNVSPTDTGK